MAINPKIINAHAAVIIWNYRDRIANDGSKFGINAVDETILSTVSLISINTNKTKSSPAGSFELTLAPTKDWVAAITPGSWMCIMMSRKKIEKKHLQKADQKFVKFFGRVDSVRANVNVDQESGAIMTTYSVVGNDWAQVFDSILYVDPVSRDPIGKDSAVGTAGRFLYENYADTISKTIGLPTSTQNIDQLIKLWGETVSSIKDLSDSFAAEGVLVKPDSTFNIPKEAATYFNFIAGTTNRANQIAKLIRLKTGKLTGPDNYVETVGDGVGFIRPDSIFGTHSFWQLLVDNCNHIVNELIPDMRWENGRPSLTLYKRVKPFAIRPLNEISKPTSEDRSSPNLSIIESLVSRFENVRRVSIPLENIVSVNAGTNWRDKYNYAEIQIDSTLIKGTPSQDTQAVSNLIKSKASIFNSNVFAREGFRPMIMQTKYLTPGAGNSIDPIGTTNWKYLLREWYFDTHNLLNGSLVFMGIEDYIQVGDNIIVDAKILGRTGNINSDSIKNKGKSFLLAHVESITHSFTVNPQKGSRSFVTTVRFVRGIITDKNGKQFRGGDGRLDIDNARIIPDKKRNSDNVFGTSTELDPDPDKLDGN